MTLARTITLRIPNDPASQRDLAALRALFADFGPSRWRVELRLRARADEERVVLELVVTGEREEAIFRALAGALPDACFAEHELEAPAPHAIEFVPEDRNALLPSQPLARLELTALCESLVRLGRDVAVVVGVESLPGRAGAEALGRAHAASSFAMISDVLADAPKRVPDWSAQRELPNANDVKAGSLYRVRVRTEAVDPDDLPLLGEVLRRHVPVEPAARLGEPLAEIRRLVHASNVPQLFQLPRPTRDTSVLAIVRTPPPHTPERLAADGVRLGLVELPGRARPLFVSRRDLGEHAYLIGKTGSGKTTMLLSMIQSAIARGDQAVFVIDPHGDLTDAVLDGVPEDQLERVHAFDLSRDDLFPGINLLDASTDGERANVIGELDQMFLGMYGPEIWGPRIQDVFRNVTQLLCLDEDGPHALVDLLWGVALGNEHVLDRWKRVAERAGTPMLELFLEQILLRRKVDGSIEELTPYFRAKLSPLLDNLHTRCILGQSRTTLDVRRLIADRTVCLFNLAKGRLSERFASIIGRILTIRVLQSALASVDLPPAERPPLALFVDEFQNLVSPTIPAILSEARKFNLSLILANQYLDQLASRSFDIGGRSDVVAAITANVGTLAAFRVSPSDAGRLSGIFGDARLAEALATMPRYHALVTTPATSGAPLVCRTERATTPADVDRRRAIFERTAAAFCRPREDIEREIAARFRMCTGRVEAPDDAIAALFPDEE